MKFTTVLSVLGLAATAQSCLLPEERGLAAPRPRDRRKRDNGLAIGSGDRFSGGTKFPLGLGTKAAGTDPGLILNVQEVQSGLAGLAKEYGITTFTAPSTTFEKRSVYGGKVGGKSSSNSAFHVYLNGGIHARERGSHDSVLYFISDLLYANKTGVGLTYGSKKYTATDVKNALSAGIVFIPLSNPDGVAYDQSSNSCWRKNRNTASATSGRPATIGVDLNRNFDFLWDFPNLFSPSVAGDVASTDPSAETYHGKSAFSEPETKNIKWVLDTYANVSWFVDLHSYAGDVLYSWGSDENQSKTPTMNFQNSAYNKARGVIPDTSNAVYSEYTPSSELSANVNTANRIKNAMSSANGRSYTAIPAAQLYATSGASDDYSYSRHFANTALSNVHAFTIEFGFGNSGSSCPFYPTATQYRQNLLETNAGFMELLLQAYESGV